MAQRGSSTFHSPMSNTLLSKSTKRCKFSAAAVAAAAAEEEKEEEEDMQSMLPGLPDHLAQHCLSHLPAPLLFSVCRSWRRLLYSPSFPPYLSLFAVLSPSDDGTCAGAGSDPIEFYHFDPIYTIWSPLPPPPPNPPLRQFLLRHPSFIARSLPVQTVATGGHLVVLAATTHCLLPALPRPLVFHPASCRWRLGPPLPAPRRWCAAGSAGGAIYIASGFGNGYSADVARSVERWNPTTGPGPGPGWERVAPLPDGRFCREAVEAVASRGKLCVVNVRGRAQKQGAMYDVRADRWEEMPVGMLTGWSGPAASAAEDEDGPIYVVDERTGALRAYDWGADRWTTVAESDRLKGATQIAAGGGRACVVCGEGRSIVVIVVAETAARGRMWVVDLPDGKQAVAVHVLPRMSPGNFS